MLHSLVGYVGDLSSIVDMYCDSYQLSEFKDLVISP